MSGAQAGGAGGHAEGGTQAMAGAGGASAGSGGHGAGGAGGRSSAAGSGGADAGPAGRSYSTNRDEFFGDSRCAALGARLCEDFEAASIDSTRWKPKLSTPTLDTTRAARGKQSLHLGTTATGGSGLETSAIFPAANNTYYGRLFVYFQALPQAPQWAHWTIAGGNRKSGSSNPITGEIRVGGQFDGMINRFGVGTDGGPTGDWTNLDADPKNAVKKVPEQQWICIEWLHKGDTNETKFFWDGVEHPSLDTTASVKHQGNASVAYELPEFGSVWVGFWNYDQGKTVTPDHFDVWIDEVALDDQRIGCGL